jgi:eukaryotic-like serine/threonine-protein kinase
VASCPSCGTENRLDHRFCVTCGSSLSVGPSGIERYTLEGVLGRGASSVVYHAIHTNTNRSVAIKALSPDFIDRPKVRERLRREAQTLQNLSHPNIVGFIELIESDKAIWIVNELIEGTSLRSLLIHANHLEPEQALAVFTGMLSGLAHAHERGLVHGDLKPENVLVEASGTAKLVDFGQAVLVGHPTAGGTAAYLAPEAIRGEAIGPATDLYSVGAMLFEVLTGRPPFIAASEDALLQLQLTEPPPQVAGLPPAIGSLVTVLLNKDPTRRPQSTIEVLAEFEVAIRDAYGSEWRRRAGVARLVEMTATHFPTLTPDSAPMTPEGLGPAALITPSSVDPPDATPAPETTPLPQPRSSARRRRPYLWAALACLIAVAGIIAFALDSPSSTKTVNSVGATITTTTKPLSSSTTSSPTSTSTSSGTSGESSPSDVRASTSWTNVTSSVQGAPPARSDAVMAYDPTSGSELLFGGGGNGQTFADTWSFQYGKWSQLHLSVQPAARTDASMVWDAQDGYMVLFGGFSPTGEALGDTWIFGEGHWAELHPSSSPPPRAYASMAYDLADHEVILFGGTSAGDSSYFQDTWAFRGGQWMRLSPSTSPSPRAGASLVDDQAAGYLLLFSGTSNFHCVCQLDDTWTFSDENWTQISSNTSPSSRDGYGLTYDPAVQAVILFGGWNANGSCGNDVGDTWAFSADSWMDLSPSSSPSARGYLQMTYDSKVNGILLFGGVSGTCGVTPTTYSDTWVLQFRSSATAITGVDITGGVDDGYTVTIDGSGFGSLPQTLPFTGDLGNFRIADGAQLGFGEWGYGGDAKTLDYESWLNDQIMVGGLGASPGDAVIGAVWNSNTGKGSAWAENVPGGAPTPSITSVSFSGSTDVTIDGSGFGSYSTLSSSIAHLTLSDWRRDPNGGGSSSTWAFQPAIISWSNNHIVADASHPGDALEAGDPVTVQLWSASDSSVRGPQTAWAGQVAL